MIQYEIELRGELNKTQRNQLVGFLKKNGKFIKEYHRTHWCFVPDYKKKIDLRIKETDGQMEFSLKVGELDKSNRKEISIPITKEKSKQAFEFLKFLGYKTALKAVRNAQIYSYQGIEWAIVEVPPNYKYYFEAEKLVKNKKDGKLAEEEIQKILTKLNLRIFERKEYYYFLHHINEKIDQWVKI